MVQLAQATREEQATPAGASGHEHAIAALDAVIRKQMKAGDSNTDSELARALVSKAIVLARLGRGAEELESYDEVIRRFTMSSDADVAGLVALAHNRRGRALVVAGRMDEALTAFDLAWATATGWKEPQLARQAAAALYATGALRKRQGRTADALSAWGDMVRQFGSSEDGEVAAKLVTADAARVSLLRQCERHNDAIRVCNDLVRRIANRREAGFRTAIGSASFRRVECLIEMDSMKAAVEACEEAAAHLKDDAGDAGVDRWRAGIEVLRGRALAGLGKVKDAAAAYSGVDREFRKSVNSIVVEQVATALVELAELMASQSEYAKSRAFCELVLRRYAESDDAVLEPLVKRARYQLARAHVGMSDAGAALGALKEWVGDAGGVVAPEVKSDGDMELLRANPAFNAYLEQARSA